MSNSGRTIFCGDVHGCLDELDELMKTLEIRQSDRVIMVGDMIDRGPDPVGVVRRVRENGWESVLGNHEDKAIRWLKNESIRESSGRPNNMMPPGPSRAAEWKSLSPEDVGWLWRLPVTIEAAGWTVVHAGLESGLLLKDQKADRMMRARFMDKETGKHVPLEADRLEQPANTVFWTEIWGGPESIVYGHSVFDSVRVDEPLPGVRCVGLDTGCVYGGCLSCMVVSDGVNEFVSVQARSQYFSYGDRAKSS